MNLPKVLQDRQQSQKPNTEEGVTIFEILLVVTVMGVLITAVTPISLRFYYTQQHTETYRTVLHLLRSAQMNAMNQVRDANSGVKITANDITVYSGNSYATRDAQYDEVVVFDSPLSITGDDEVVFTQTSGLPDSNTVISCK